MMRGRFERLLALVLLAGGCEPNGELGDDGETEGELAESLAHDITIDRIEINQGVTIPIVEQGEWIAAEQRNAPIVNGRAGLLRVYWTLAPEFEPREIEARLTLTQSDGSERVLAERLEITGPADPSSLARTFTFELGGEDLVPGVEFSVALWELDPAYADQPEPSVAPISPPDGPAPVGVEAKPAELKVVLVPIHQEFAGCSNQADFDSILTSLELGMFANNPIQRLDLRIREQPLVITTPPANLGELLGHVQQVRAADDPDDNVYYHGIYSQCDSQTDFGGLATLITDADIDSAFLRASVGTHLKWTQEWNVRHFVHEVGHLQGLAHVECPGKDADQLEQSYPYADGLVGVWGYGLFDHVLRDPAVSHDYMSYCDERYGVSDWTWRKTYRRIVELTSWDSQERARGELRTILVGWVGADGERSWWIVRGRAGELRRYRLGEGQGELIAVALPDELPERLEVDGVEVPADIRARADTLAR